MYNLYPSGETEQQTSNIYGDRLPKNPIYTRLSMISYLLKQQNAKTQQ